MNEKSNSSFILGVLIGAAVAYLFTTENGKKVKEDLLKEGTKLLEVLGDGLDELQENKDEIQEKINTTIDDLEEKAVTNVENVAEDLVENITNVVESVPEHIEEIQKSGRRFFSKKHSTTES